MRRYGYGSYGKLNETMAFDDKIRDYSNRVARGWNTSPTSSDSDEDTGRYKECKLSRFNYRETRELSGTLITLYLFTLISEMY